MPSMTISLLPTSTFIKIVVSECVEASLCIELPGYPLLTFLPVMCVQVMVLGGSVRTRTESLEQIPSRQNQSTGRAVENTYSFV